MSIYKKSSKTEKVLLILISMVFSSFLVSSLVSKKGALFTYADESSGSSEASSSNNEEESEKSSSNEDEESTKSVEEEKSTPSVDEVSTPSIDEISTPSIEEMSTSGTGDEVSTKSVDEMSTPSVISEPSITEESVKSGMNIENIGDVIPAGDNFAYVYEDEKLFFIIPVKIEKQLSLDNNGVILEVKQSFFSRLLSLLSF